MKQKCNFNDCDKYVLAKGYCTGHYGQHQRGEQIRKLRKSPVKKKSFDNIECLFDTCQDAARVKGYCKYHYAQALRGDELTERVYKYKNTICEVTACGKKVSSIGLCERHYKRHRAYSIPRDVLINLEEICEICGSKERIHTDHSHLNNSFRGLLCNNCNTALGLLKENKQIAENLIKYIEKHMQ